MGLFEKDEHTLYKPSGPTGGGGGGGGAQPAAQSGNYRPASGAMGMEDDEDRASLGEILKFSLNAAKRRKVLSLVVVMIGAGLTAAAVRLAPRTYQSTGEVLVVTNDDGQAGGWNTENRRQQLEWERQVRSRETIDGIVRDAQLVEKWDDMRQPHRRLLDEINAKMGDKPPTTEQKFGAVENMVENNLKLTIDQSTVSIQCEWSDPEASRDIVQAALSRFIDKRYQTEVGTILTRIKPLEDQLEAARLVLERIDPSLAPPKEEPTEATPADKLVVVAKEPSPEAVEAGQRLQGARERQQNAAAKLGELEGAKQAKIARLEAEKAEKGATMGAAHPEMVNITLTLQKAREDTSEIISARASKAAADAEVADLAAKAGVAIPSVRRYSPAPPPAKKMDELTTQRITAARDEYSRKKDALDSDNLKLRVAEAAFKSKYQITRPPDVPMAPKKPVGLMVGLGGALATLLVMLALATLRDRSVGIFFEAKHVRDRLKLPVLGDIREVDIAS